MGQYEKAAGWAVFHGNVEKAIEILASSKKGKVKINVYSSCWLFSI